MQTRWWTATKQVCFGHGALILWQVLWRAVNILNFLSMHCAQAGWRIVRLALVLGPWCAAVLHSTCAPPVLKYFSSPRSSSLPRIVLVTPQNLLCVSSCKLALPQGRDSSCCPIMVLLFFILYLSFPYGPLRLGRGCRSRVRLRPQVRVRGESEEGTRATGRVSSITPSGSARR